MRRLEDRATTITDLGQGSDMDYQAMLLMFRVSEQLAVASDLQGFLVPVADMVLSSVEATTVVVLLTNSRGELDPKVIRHLGELDPGEVPVSRGILDRVLRERETVVVRDATQEQKVQLYFVYTNVYM